MIETDDLILEYVFELKTKIRQLMNPDVLNCPDHAYHGLSKEALLKKLMILNNKGYIDFFINDEAIKNNFLDVSELINMPFIDLWYVELTAKGGKKWEDRFKPNWKNYVSMSSSFLNEETCDVEFEAGSIEIIEHLLNKYQLNLSSISEIIELRPWRPTYWKTVDKGFRITFNVNQNFMFSASPFNEYLEDSHWRIPAW